MLCLIFYLFIILSIIIYNGDWGLGIGDWGLGPIPNPQSPIPKIYKILNSIINTLTIYKFNNN